MAADLRSVTEALSAAKSRAALLHASQQIQRLPEHWQRDQAARIVKQKLNEFKHN